MTEISSGQRLLLLGEAKCPFHKFDCLQDTDADETGACKEQHADGERDEETEKLMRGAGLSAACPMANRIEKFVPDQTEIAGSPDGDPAGRVTSKERRAGQPRGRRERMVSTGADSERSVFQCARSRLRPMRELTRSREDSRIVDQGNYAMSRGPHQGA